MFGGDQQTLLSNAAAGNGSDTEWSGGRTVFAVDSDFSGGGSVRLQIKLPNGGYVDVAGTTLTADGAVVLEHLPRGLYRAVAATSTSNYAYLFR